jgi:hypothetical protein
MSASNYEHCVWLNRNGRWSYAVAGRTDPSEGFSSKEEAIQAMHAKIAELERQEAMIKKPCLHSAGAVALPVRSATPC